MMVAPVAVLDANVLYSAPLRHLLIWLAVSEAFRARWTDRIQNEWTRALLANRSELDPARIARTRELMDSSIDDVIVTGYEALIAGLTLPDMDDRHVLAAAIRCRATVIVTKNLVDFPGVELARHGIVAMHPDGFVRSLLESGPDTVIEAARSHRAQLRNPPRSASEYLDVLEREGLPESAAVLRTRQQDL